MNKPLHGLVVAVTSRVDDAEDEDEPSYSSLTARVVELGGTVSKMVHRRVAFVMCARACQAWWCARTHALGASATENSIRLNTQRVRKARRRGLDVLSPEYLDVCERAGSLAPRDPYKL